MLLNGYERGYTEFPVQIGLSNKSMEREYGSVENWYAACVRWISSWYNQYSPLRDNYDTSRTVLTNNNTMMGESDQIIENFLFYQGDQPMREYYYFIQDPNPNLDIVMQTQGGSAAAIIPTPWIKGHKIYQLISYMQGVFAGRIAAARLSVENISGEVRTLKHKMINKAILRYEFADIISKLAEETGVEYEPFPTKEFQSSEEAIDYITKTPQDWSEKEALRILNHIEARNETKSIMEKVFKNVIIGRYGGVYVYLDANGRLQQHNIPPQNLILDRRVDADFHGKDEFIGYIQFMTPEEIVTKYPDLSEEDREDILRMARSMPENLWKWNVTTNRNFNWWDYQSECKVAVVTCFWRSYKDSKMYKDGSKWRYLNPNQKNKRGDFEVETVRKATLIGNKYLTNYGEDECIIYDPKDPSRVMLPILWTAPGTHMGYNKSLVDRLKHLQNNIDAIENKINDSLSHDFGNVYIFDGARIKGQSPEEILSDIKKHRLSIITRRDGEELRPDEAGPLVEKLDMSISANVFRYVELQREKERIMEEIASTSKIALGQQQTYVGLSTQQNTIAQNTRGSEHIYSAVLKLYSDIMAYSMEKVKIGYLHNKNRHVIEEITDERGVNFLKETKDLSFAELMTKVHIEDIVDDQMKAALIQAAFAALQNQLIEFLDYIKLIQIRTYTEMSRYFETVLERKKKEAERQKILQETMALANIQAQGQMMQEQQMIKEQGAMDRKLVDAGVKGAELQQQQMMAEQQLMQQAGMGNQ
jgi:hypothetical protein